MQGVFSADAAYPVSAPNTPHDLAGERAEEAMTPFDGKTLIIRKADLCALVGNLACKLSEL